MAVDRKWGKRLRDTGSSTGAEGASLPESGAADRTRWEAMRRRRRSPAMLAD
ncbi:MAG: hypothetical protein AW07_04660 [Candidatus Accumulibacter sp. SK-11]|nr:MAG: hypothetical protein AW07_04660 [Candidatus Accumulibacter sp. SK-11]